MKKTSTLVVGIVMLTCFLIFSFRLNAQDGPRVEFKLRGTFYDSAFISAQTPPSYGFNIRSVGDEPLMFKVTLSNPDFISSFSDSMQILEPGSNTDYTIFRPTTSGLATCIVKITTNDPNHEITTYTIQSFGLESPDDGSPSMQIIGPAQIEAKISTVTSTSFEITNSGNAELHYSIDADSLITQVDGARLFSTGFDELELGATQSQGGWSELMYVFYITENQQWKVENINPFLGTQHLRCTTNGMPGSNGVELYSPAPPENTTVIDMMADITLGSTWQFMARDQDYSSTILVIAPDGSLSIVNEYPYDVHPVSAILPEGYFNLRFTINTETHELSITADGAVLYSGFNYATNFTEFSIGLSSETAGVTLDIDNFRFMDSQSIKLLSVEPQSGSIAPMSSKMIDVQVDTRSIDADTFSEIFTIHSNDPNQPVAYVPVTTVVKPNVLPVLTGNFNPTIVSGESILLTFSAVDPDDSLVSVTFNNFNGSGNGELVEVASGNGFVTYTIITYGSDQSDGSLQMTILAEDARGGITSNLFRLTMYATGQNDFSLTNFKTGVKVATFTDTITVDVAHTDFAKLTIQANASVDEYEWDETIVGFKFIVDGVEINKDQSKPFYLNKGFIQKLSKGYHNLTAVSYYIYENKEYRIGTGVSTIHVINSAAVTRYDVVNGDGVKVMDLTEGSIIDLSQIGTNEFNIIAHTNISSVRSVKFALNNVTARIDNGAPYALAGNALGDTFWKPKAGQYTLSAVPYLQSYGWGVKGVPLTVHFQIVKGVKPTATIARTEATYNLQESAEEVDPENVLSIYPVPVVDDLHIELDESVKGNVIVGIMTIQGKSLHLKKGHADEFRKYTVSTQELGISSGVYVVMVTLYNGKRVTRKFIKQ